MSVNTTELEMKMKHMLNEVQKLKKEIKTKHDARPGQDERDRVEGESDQPRQSQTGAKIAHPAERRPKLKGLNR